MERPYTKISDLLKEQDAIEQNIDKLQTSYLAYDLHKSITRLRLEVHQKKLKEVREQLNALKK